ncbi:MAG TPA: diguanylate cyclase [Capillimicrobium sp.]|jgi:diguanylate cyclase (GGDEF)-like protein/putative nucleotidyltransferase with HDIG domain
MTGVFPEARPAGGVRAALRRAVDPWLAPDRAQTAPWKELGTLYLGAGLLSLIMLSVGALPDAHREIMWLFTAAALGIGAVMLRIEVRSSPAIELGLYIGVVMVCAAIALTEAPASPYSLLLAWVGLEGALLLGPWAAMRLTIASAGGYAIALAFLPSVTALTFGFYVATLGTMLVTAAMAWLLRVRVDRLVRQLSETARRDALTGLLNRRGYSEAMGVEMARATRTGQPLSIVLADIDHFKAINDRHGHSEGDEALIAVAVACDRVRRTTDHIARIGGEEFAFILPGTDPAGATVFAERLRREIARELEAIGIPGTASAGVASYPHHAATGDALLDAADRALYLAKDLGRDRCVLYSTGVADELAARRGQEPTTTGQLDAVLLLAETLDLRDPSTARHSQTVATLCQATAEQLGLETERVERVRLAGLLHDIGKIGVADALLHKPGALTDEEYEEVKRHAEIGARILLGAGLRDLAGWVLHHHERPDGRGYPAGLQADEIPLEARILSVADAYEAMVADRPYSPAVAPEAAAAELRACAGAQFDDEVVAAFLAGTTVASAA